MKTRISQYNFTDEQMIAAIKGSCGIVSNIADSLGCDWNTAKRYIEMSEHVKQAYSDESERVIDKAENKLQGAIDSGDMQMVKWYLATKGKRRGYYEKQELENTGKINVVIIDADDNNL
jgi:hypothetical protein